MGNKVIYKKDGEIKEIEFEDLKDINVFFAMPFLMVLVNFSGVLISDHKFKHYRTMTP